MPQLISTALRDCVIMASIFCFQLLDMLVLGSFFWFIIVDDVLVTRGIRVMSGCDWLKPGFMGKSCSMENLVVTGNWSVGPAGMLLSRVFGWRYT